MVWGLAVARRIPSGVRPLATPRGNVPPEKKDRRFPVAFAHRLQSSFPAGGARLYIAAGAGHSDSSKTPGYAAAVKSFLDDHLPAMETGD